MPLIRCTRKLLAEMGAEVVKLELAPDGISATHVMPGMFETEGLTIEGIVIDGPVPQNDFPMLAQRGPDAMPGFTPTRDK